MIFYKVLPIAIYIVAVVFLYLSWKCTFALKPSRKQLKKLQGKTLYRYAGFQHGPIIRFKKSKPKEPSTGKRAVVYFFVEKPSIIRMWMNKIQKLEACYTVPFDSLDSEKVLYRQSDKVVAYLDDYVGPVNSVEKVDPKNWLYTIGKYVYINCFAILFFLVTFIAIIYVVTASAIFLQLQNLVMNHIFSLFYLSVIIFGGALVYLKFFYRVKD